MSAIDRLKRLGNAWAGRPELIEQARQEGVTWVAIAEALHMTRHGVVKLHATLKDRPTSGTRVVGTLTVTGPPPIEGVRIVGDGSFDIKGNA